MEHHVASLARHLVVLGNEVEIATLTPNAEPVHPSVRTTVIPTISSRVIRYANAARPFHPPVPDPAARRALRQLVRQFRPDVTHAHSRLAFSLPPEQMRRLVVTLHDYSLICHRSTLRRNGDTDCAGPELSVCARCQPGGPDLTMRTATMAVATRAGRHTLRPAAYIAVSRCVRDRLGPYLDAPVTVVPNFVGDLAVSHMPGVANDTPYALYAGDPGEHKGLRELVDLWAGPTPPALPLRVASTQPVPFALPAGVTAARLDLTASRAAIRGAAFVVVPSRWDDPCPTVAIEALTLGTPVIGFRVGGLSELVRDGITGHLSDPGDVADLRRRIDQLALDPDERARLAVNSLAHAPAFSAAAVVPRVLEVYRSIATGDGVSERSAVAEPV